LISATGNNVRNKDGTIGSVNCEVRIWDIENEIVLHRLLGHAGIVSSVAYNNKNVKYPLVISGSWDGTVKIWNAETGKLYQTLNTKTPVYDIAYNLRNDTIFAGLQDGSIDIFERNNNNTGIYTALLSMKQIDKEIIAKDIRKNLEKTAKTARKTLRARSSERAKSSSTKNTRRARSASARARSTSVKNTKAVAELTTKDPLQGRRLTDVVESEDVRRLMLEYLKKKPTTEITNANTGLTPESEYESESDNESDNDSDNDSD
jgi:WD40 repeat protein